MDALFASIDSAALLNWTQAMGLKLLAAGLTFLIGRWVAKALVEFLRKAMTRGQADATLASFVANVAYGLLMAIVVITALGQLGISTTSAAALLGGAGIAIGLSLKDQLSSFAAGVMLILFRPFGRGDYIEAGGTSGTVDDITIVATTLKTPNNQQVTVPNNHIWGSNIVNYSSLPTRRIDLPMGISYDADFRQAKTILKEIAAADERVLQDSDIWVGVTELGDSAVVLSFRCWVNTPDFFKTRSELLEAAKTRFDEAGIGIPYPQMDVHMHQAERPE